jgi:arginyl-tRNA synthetase
MDETLSVLAQVKEDIRERIVKAIERAKERGDLPTTVSSTVKLEVPQRPEIGDFATNIALAMAKEVKSSGRTVAGIIVKHLNIDDSYIKRVDIAGPGFINFFLDVLWLQPAMASIWSEGPLYGRSDYGQGKKVLLEFVSANPTGPLNVVNARAAAVGDSLANLLTLSGHRVHKEYYINDAGNQVELLGASLLARYRQALGEEVSIPENGYPGDYLVEMAQDLVKKEGANLLNLSDKELHEYMKGYALSVILEGQKETLKSYGLEYDNWFSEKSLRDTGAHTTIIDYLREKGLTYEEEEAIWFRSTDFGDDKDRVLVKSDGNVTYLVPDIAYHKNKMERGFDHLIDILGPDHHGYVTRLSAGLQALGYPKDCLEVLIVQVVRLLRGKELVKVSKRGGEFVSMDELIEEVGKDAARFFFLMRSPNSHLDFDLDLAKLQSNENPVFYVQYAHARIASILRQAHKEGQVAVLGPNEVDFSLLRAPSEISLMKTLSAFPEEVYEAARTREPNRIVKYMINVATAYHSFYTQCRVLGEDKKLSGARLYLCRLTQTVLANALRIIGVSAPDSM